MPMTHTQHLDTHTSNRINIFIDHMQTILDDSIHSDLYSCRILVSQSSNMAYSCITMICYCLLLHLSFVSSESNVACSCMFTIGTGLVSLCAYNLFVKDLKQLHVMKLGIIHVTVHHFMLSNSCIFFQIHG